MSVFRTIPITISNAADGLSNAVDLEDQDFAGILCRRPGPLQACRFW